MLCFVSREIKTHLSIPTEVKPNWLLYWFPLEAKKAMLNLHPYKWNGRSGIFMEFFITQIWLSTKHFAKQWLSEKISGHF